MESTYGKRIKQAMALNNLLGDQFKHLDKLITKGYIEKKGKKYLVTAYGKSIVENWPATAKEYSERI